MPDPADDTMRGTRLSVQLATTRSTILTCAAAVTVLLSLTACGARVEAGPTGGLVETGDAMSAQQEALAQRSKYGKTGRVTQTISEDTYNFVCE